MHSEALRRGFLHSYLLQRLNKSRADFRLLPGLQYFYLSSVADVSSGSGTINGSAIYFDSDCTYANWERILLFNSTLSLFAPRAYRIDDSFEPYNWLREPTNDSIEVYDLGAADGEHNYTDPKYGNNPFIRDIETGIDFIPDFAISNPSQIGSSKYFQYTIKIKFAKGSGEWASPNFETFDFFGPPYANQKDDFVPVRFTPPYFDCGFSNQWIISSVAPIVDFMPRYSIYTHIRRPRFVGVTVMDTALDKLEINPCPISPGNSPPNRFAGTAKCKPTTICDPLPRWGLESRGGYQCMCKPGYRYPYWQEGPFQGVDIEQATAFEYENGFDCIRVEWRQVWPYNELGPNQNRSKRGIYNFIDQEQKFSKTFKIFGSDQKNQDHLISITIGESPNKLKNYNKTFSKIFPNFPVPYIAKIVLQRINKRIVSPAYERKRRYTREIQYSSRYSSFDDDAFERVLKIMNNQESINKDNCNQFSRDQLELPGDVAYGSEIQLEYQARTALRLSHFISAFLQTVAPQEKYGNYLGDGNLNEEQLFGEVISTVMGDTELSSSGIFFDRWMFQNSNGVNKELFAPCAFKTMDSNANKLNSSKRSDDNSFSNVDDPAIPTTFWSLCFAGYGENYLNEPWFSNVKSRWGANQYGLKKYLVKPYVRRDIAGSGLKRFEHFPLYFRAPDYSGGWWSNPYFDCNILKRMGCYLFSAFLWT